MSVKRKPHMVYTREFKVEALHLMEETEMKATEIAMQLGIRHNQLYKWKDQMSKQGTVPSAKRGR